MRAIFGRIIEGKKRTNPTDAGHEHYYSVSVMGEGGYPMRLDIDGRQPLEPFKGVKSGTPVELQVEWYPRRCKAERQDGSLYDTTLFAPSVQGLSAA